MAQIVYLGRLLFFIELMKKTISGFITCSSGSVEQLPLSKNVIRSKPDLQPFWVEFACSHNACVSFLHVLKFPQKNKHMHVRLVGNSKLGVSESVSGFLSLCGPVLDL